MSIYLSGNMVIDALKITVTEYYTHEHLKWAKNSKLSMITAYRREKLGGPMKNMLKAIKKIICENPDIKTICPIHMNSAVREAIKEKFGEDDRIKIIELLKVLNFYNFMVQVYLIFIDIGGIKEEVFSLGKPVLVMRNITKRPDGDKSRNIKFSLNK